MGFEGVEVIFVVFGLSIQSDGVVITEWGRLWEGQVLGGNVRNLFSFCLRCIKLVIKMGMSYRQLNNKSNKLGID